MKVLMRISSSIYDIIKLTHSPQLFLKHFPFLTLTTQAILYAYSSCADSSVPLSVDNGDAYIPLFMNAK